MYGAESGKQIKVYWILAALAILTIVVYLPVLGHEFVEYDDPVYLLENSHVQGGLTLKGIVWAFTSGYASNWHPLTWLSHMLDVQLFGMKPAGHHLVNLVFHVTSTALLFTVFRKMTGAVWQSAAVALLFAIHPLHVESVAWVAERKDVLSATFWMLTMLAYLHYVRRPSPIRYLVVAMTFLLGLMAKPMLVTLPFVLLLLDYWPLGRFTPASASTGISQEGLRPAPLAPLRLIGEKLPLLALSAASSIITYMVQEKGGAIEDYLTLAFRINNALIAYYSYIQKMFWPSGLAVFYPLSLYSPPAMQIIGAAVFLLLVSSSVVWLGRRHPYLVTGWLWYLGTLVPVIGIVHIGNHAMADRYSYLPLIGLFVMIAWGVAEISQKLHLGKVVLRLACLAVFSGLMTVTWLQVRHWKNSITLFSHAIEVTDNNWVAHNNLGKALITKGNLNEALMHLENTIRLKPNFTDAYLTKGSIYGMVGDYPNAIATFENVIWIDPKNAKAHYNLGIAYLWTGNRDRALLEYQILQGLSEEYATMLKKTMELQ